MKYANRIINASIVVAIIFCIYFFKFRANPEPQYREDVANQIIEPGQYIIDKTNYGIYDVRNLKTDEYLENVRLYIGNEITIKEQWEIDGRADSKTPDILSAGRYEVGENKDLLPGEYELELNPEYTDYEISIQNSKTKKEEFYKIEDGSTLTVFLENKDSVNIITEENGEEVFKVVSVTH